MVNTEKLDSLYDEAYEKANTAARAMNEGKPMKEIKSLKKIATDAVSAYNTEAAHVAYKRWVEEGGDKKDYVIKTAIRNRFIPGVKKLSFKETKNSGTMYAKFDDVTNAKIDFVDLAKTVGYDRFANEDWINACGKLAFIIAGYVNNSLAADPGFQYIIKEAAAAFNFPVDVNPSTKENVMVALQQVFDYICFIDDGNGKNVISVSVNSAGECSAWNYIMQCMTRQGREVGNVLISGTGKIVELVHDCMNIAMTHKDYLLICDD